MNVVIRVPYGRENGKWKCITTTPGLAFAVKYEMPRGTRSWTPTTILYRSVIFNEQCELQTLACILKSITTALFT